MRQRARCGEKKCRGAEGGRDERLRIAQWGEKEGKRRMGKSSVGDDCGDDDEHDRECCSSDNGREVISIATKIMTTTVMAYAEGYHRQEVVAGRRPSAAVAARLRWCR